MRENIGLFRAKRKDNGEWVEGYYIKHKYGSYILCGDEVANCCALRNKEIYEIDHETICEFTGLLDKNGKKIFENDILEVEVERDNGEDYYNVYTWKEKVKYVVKDILNIETDFIFELVTTCGFSSKDCEIIGNRFDNPELLEKVEE